MEEKKKERKKERKKKIKKKRKKKEKKKRKAIFSLPILLESFYSDGNKENEITPRRLTGPMSK